MFYQVEWNGNRGHGRGQGQGPVNIVVPHHHQRGLDTHGVIDGPPLRALYQDVEGEAHLNSINPVYANRIWWSLWIDYSDSLLITMLKQGLNNLKNVSTLVYLTNINYLQNMA